MLLLIAMLFSTPAHAECVADIQAAIGELNRSAATMKQCVPPKKSLTTDALFDKLQKSQSDNSVALGAVKAYSPAGDEFRPLVTAESLCKLPDDKKSKLTAWAADMTKAYELAERAADDLADVYQEFNQNYPAPKLLDRLRGKAEGCQTAGDDVKAVREKLGAATSSCLKMIDHEDSAAHALYVVARDANSGLENGCKSSGKCERVLTGHDSWGNNHYEVDQYDEFGHLVKLSHTDDMSREEADKFIDRNCNE